MIGRGILVAPLVGILAMARGGLVVVIALLYVTFSVGALARQGWAWWLGLTVAVLNVSGVLWLVIAGAPLMPTLISAVIPVVLVCYLIAPAGRQALLPRPVAIR